MVAQRLTCISVYITNDQHSTADNNNRLGPGLTGLAEMEKHPRSDGITSATNETAVTLTHPHYDLSHHLRELYTKRLTVRLSFAVMVDGVGSCLHAVYGCCGRCAPCMTGQLVEFENQPQVLQT